MQIILVRELLRHFAQDYGQARDMWERTRMAREVGKKLLLAEEDRGVVGMCGLPELDAEEATVDLLTDVLGMEMAFREKAQAKADSC